MNRITESNPYWMGEEMWASACEPDDEMMEEVYCKLWSYENTGLEPEEICFRASRWISVKDRLPTDPRFVLVHVKHPAQSHYPEWSCIMTDMWLGDRWVENADEEVHEVTHWMPLPEPPKEG